MPAPRPSRPGCARRLGQPGRDLDRAAHRGRLVLGLLELPLGHAPGDDPGAGVDVGPAVLEDRAPDRDRRVEVAVVAEVADGAAVEAPPLPFRGGDELHRPDLRGAGEGAGREDGPERVEGVEVRPEPPLDVAHEMEDVAVLLDLHVLADRHRAGPRHPPEVVAPEVDEHDVLGPLLGIALELLGEDRVLLGVGAAGSRAGDRVGRQLVAVELDEELGARADDLEAGDPGEEQVRRRVDPSQAAVEADAVELPARSRDRSGGRTTGAGRGRPGSPRPRRSRPWRPRPRGRTRRARGWRRWPRRRDGGRRAGPVRRTASGGRARHLGGRRPGRLLERLEDRRLGDPVAALEVGRPRCGATRSPTGCGSGGRRR